MDLVTTTISLIIVNIVLLYFVAKRSLSYWKRRGVEYINPEFPWGTAKKFIKGELSLGDQVTKFYNEFKTRGVVGGGVYYSINPAFIPVDLELIKNIVLKDLNHFINHGIYVNEEDDPLSGHLFALEDERWRYLRTKLTPTFTSGKLKMMYHTMDNCTEGLIDVLKQRSTYQDPVDIKEVVSRFTTDIIGSCAFGIECNSLKNPNSDFRQYGKKVFEPDTYDKLKSILFFTVPRKILKMFHAKRTNTSVEKFFMNIVKNTVEYRETNNIHRNDFMHLLLQLKNRGKLCDDDNFEIKNNGSVSNAEQNLTMNELAAQCFVFFTAGFETSANAMTFGLLELAQNQDIQEKLREDIARVTEKYGGKLSYDAIMEMSYLNKVVHETLRKHPPFPILPRRCTKTYKIPGTDIILEHDTLVQIPVQSIQSDPEYFPNPDKFDPERFSDEGKAQKMPFLAFGEGPRNCIGSRFALLQTKVGILSIIKNFRITLNKKTKIPIKYYTKNITTAVDGDVWLNLSQIH